MPGEKFSPSFESVEAERLSNVYDHIVGTSPQLADALDDAEANAGVSIMLAGDTLSPYDYKGDTSAWDLSDGTMIHGHTPYQTGGAATDGINADGGTIIDAAGNTLFTGTDIDGLSFQNFQIIDPDRAMDFGDASNRGLNFSQINNVHIYNASASHAIRLYNWHFANLTQVSSKASNGLVEAINTSPNGFSPGNSVWTSILCATQNDIDSGIKIDGTSASTKTNAMNLVRPQVISAGSTTANGGAGILLEGSSNNEVMRSALYGVNVEGDFQHHVRFKHAKLNHIQFNTAAGAPEWNVYNDTGASDNHVFGNGNISVYSDLNNNWTWGEFSELGGNRGRGMAVDANFDSNTVQLRRGLNGRELELRDDQTLHQGVPLVNREGIIHDQRGQPSTSDVNQGDGMVYVSNGSASGEEAGDLVYAYNDGGTIETAVIVDESADAS